MIVSNAARGELRQEIEPDAGFGRFRLADWPKRTHPEIDAWICRRILAGIHPRAVVVALDGRITLRTAYRWKAALIGLEEVTIGGWRATFALRRGQGPTRITEWRRVPRRQ